MDKIRKYVENLFKDVPRSKKARELQEELIYDLEDKYSDLIKDGKTDKDAYTEIIAGIGDMDELLGQLEKTDVTNNDEFCKKRALAISISIAFYFLSVILVVICEEMGLPEFVSVSSFLLLSGVGTCILVYHFISTPKYTKKEETIVEEFKEWKSNKNNNKEVRNAISSIIWTLTVIIYFIISFMFSIWHISWIVFLMAMLLESIVSLAFKLGVK